MIVIYDQKEYDVEYLISDITVSDGKVSMTINIIDPYQNVRTSNLSNITIYELLTCYDRKLALAAYIGAKYNRYNYNVIVLKNGYKYVAICQKNRNDHNGFYSEIINVFSKPLEEFMKTNYYKALTR